MDKIDQILDALTTAHADGEVASRIKTFREGRGLTLVEFADLVGATPKTASRWEMEGEAKPSVSRVRSWKLIFGAKAPNPTSALTSGANDHVPVISPTEIPGIFPNRYVFARIIKSAEIWVLRCRSSYQVASAPDAQQVLIKQIMGPEPFRLHFVWIDPTAFSDVEEGRGVLPADTPKKSFQMLKEYAEFKVGSKDTSSEERERALSRIKDSIFGHELTVKDAASIGLSNSPIAMLVVVYRKSEAEALNRPLDVFFEVPIELYDLTDRNRVPERSPSWCQLSPGLARQYWNDVWRGFEVIRNRQLQEEEGSYTGG